MFEEAKRLYSESCESNYFDIKELYENLSECYSRKGNGEQASLYREEAEKLSSLSIGVSSASQTNFIEDLDVFLKSEALRIFYGYRRCTMRDLQDAEAFEDYDCHHAFPLGHVDSYCVHSFSSLRIFCNWRPPRILS